MCRLRNIAMRDFQESVTTEDRRTDRQTADKVIPMCHFASQASQQELEISGRQGFANGYLGFFTSLQIFGNKICSKGSKIVNDR